jgi:hypothetical protein
VSESDTEEEQDEPEGHRGGKRVREELEDDSSHSSDDSLEGNRTLHMHAVLNQMQGKGYVMAVHKLKGGPEH